MRRSSPVALRVAWVLCTTALVRAVHLELSIAPRDGFPPQEEFDDRHIDTRYRFVTKHCVSGVCSTIGIVEVDKTPCDLYTSANMAADEPVVFNVRVRRRVPVPNARNLSVQVTDTEFAPVMAVRSSVEPTSLERNDGGLVVSGRTTGRKGLLSHQWQVDDDLVAEYTITSSMKELRSCDDGCLFQTGRSRQVDINPHTTTHEGHGIAVDFTLRIVDHSHEDPMVQSGRVLLAARVLERAEQVSQDGALASNVPADDDISVSESKLAYRLAATFADGSGSVFHPVLKLRPRDSTAKEYTMRKPVIIAFRVPHGIEDDPLKHHFDIFEPRVSRRAKRSLPYLGKVARQYERMYDGVAEEIRNHIPKGSDVLFVARSRAAGMATLAFADVLLSNDVDVGKVGGVVFGAPLIGDRSFAKTFSNVLPKVERYDFFDRVVLADSETGQVDAETTMPLAVMEYVVNEPGMRALDCLRQYTDVEAIAPRGPGHLTHYAPVGRQVLLFEDGSFTSRRTASEAKLDSKADASAVEELGRSIMVLEGTDMGAYIERLILHASRDWLRKQKNPDDSPPRVSRGMSRALIQNAHPRETRGGLQAIHAGHRLFVHAKYTHSDKEVEGGRAVFAFLCGVRAGRRRRRCQALHTDANDGKLRQTTASSLSGQITTFSSMRLLPSENVLLRVGVVESSKSPHCRGSGTQALPSEYITVGDMVSLKVPRAGRDEQRSPGLTTRKVAGGTLAFAVELIPQQFNLEDLATDLPELSEARTDTPGDMHGTAAHQASGAWAQSPLDHAPHVSQGNHGAEQRRLSDMLDDPSTREGTEPSERGREQSIPAGQDIPAPIARSGDDALRAQRSSNQRTTAHDFADSLPMRDGAPVRDSGLAQPWQASQPDPAVLASKSTGETKHTQSAEMSALGGDLAMPLFEPSARLAGVASEEGAPKDIGAGKAADSSRDSLGHAQSTSSRQDRYSLTARSPEADEREQRAKDIQNAFTGHTRDGGRSPADSAGIWNQLPHVAANSDGPGVPTAADGDHAREQKNSGASRNRHRGHHSHESDPEVDTRHADYTRQESAVASREDGAPSDGGQRQPVMRSIDPEYRDSARAIRPQGSASALARGSSVESPGAIEAERPADLPDPSATGRPGEPASPRPFIEI